MSESATMWIGPIPADATLPAALKFSASGDPVKTISWSIFMEEIVLPNMPKTNKDELAAWREAAAKLVDVQAGDGPIEVRTKTQGALVKALPQNMQDGRIQRRCLPYYECIIDASDEAPKAPPKPETADTEPPADDAAAQE